MTQRVLVAVVHYFHPEGDGSLGSLRKDPAGRAAALGQAISALHDLFNDHSICPDYRSTFVPRAANTDFRYQVDVRVLTTQDRTVFDHLAIDPDLFTEVKTGADPKMLGFEAHVLFQRHADEYDRFLFLEDDIILHDPWFLAKLDWFETKTGALLQPRLYEVTGRDGRGKVYIDGDYVPDQVARHRKVSGPAVIETQALGQTLRFTHADNPHSGCFCLSRKQLKHWMAQPWFLDRDTSLVRSFESAASLGILKTFDLYKADLPCASFLEVQHWGEDEMNQILPLAGDALAPRSPRGVVKPEPLCLAELQAEVKQSRMALRELRDTPLWQQNARMAGEIQQLDTLARHWQTHVARLKTLLRRHAVDGPKAERDLAFLAAEQALMKQNARMEGGIRNLDSALTHHRAELQAAQREIERLQAELAATRASTSWRITAPLRWLGTLLKRTWS